MEPNPAAVLPSRTFSKSFINAVLGGYLESAATFEEIANENNQPVGAIVDCLEEQMPFLERLLHSMELRARLMALRVEVVALNALREVADVGRDPEARRKAASKLLSHLSKRLSPPPAAKAKAKANAKSASSQAAVVPPAPPGDAPRDPCAQHCAHPGGDEPQPHADSLEKASGPGSLQGRQ